jgi:dTDP-glucose pyrophosphorylase
MKVVILAGGFGTRLAEETEVKPKPMPSMLVMIKINTPKVPMAIKKGSNCVTSFHPCLLKH